MQVLEHLDPVTGASGYLVYDRADCRLAAGGCRMQAGLSLGTLTELAARMTLKQRVLGLNVDGAKCGIAYDPRSEGARDVLARFLAFLREELTRRFSMGCDMGTSFDQLEAIARGVGIDSIKGAVRTAQGFTPDEFARRMSLLAAPVGAHTVSRRRAGHALAHAALTAADKAGYRRRGLHIGLQGFGNLGRAAAESMAECGAVVTAIADEHGCAVNSHGLDVPRMLQTDKSCPVVGMVDPRRSLPRTMLMGLPLDLLVLAAGEDAMTPEQAEELRIPVVVVGANCGLRPDVEKLLTERGVTVVPDIIGGSGGSASMEALFGPARTPSPEEVLDLVAGIVTELVSDVLEGARARRLPPAQVALDMAAAAAVRPDQRPYGASPYLPSGPPPRGHRPHTVPRGTRQEGNPSVNVVPQAREDCRHERSHIVDSAFYGHRYSTPTSRRIFCDQCRFQRWLDVEAALALAEADLDIIPADAAKTIAKSAQVTLLDLGAVQQEIRRTGHSLVGLLRVFQTVCGDAGEYLHYGATTQDIQDTGQSLEMRDSLDSLSDVLSELIARLIELAEEHQRTVALGRTHAQPALPMSFGLKVAGWMDELIRHAERIESMGPRVLAAQLFGGVGSMAGFGEHALELLERFAVRLDLSVPLIGWHVARDRIAEYTTTLAMVAGTMGRIADEVRMLSRPEFAEVQEGWRYGQVGSSTMPHKRNPEACEQVVVMARLAAGLAPTALTAMSGDNERDSRALRLEWACVPDVTHYTLAAAEITRTIVGGLTVNTARMRDNVHVVADQVATEGLMLAMGRRVGKQTAHEVVYELSQAARRDGLPLRDLVRAHAVGAELADEELNRIFDPAQYLGRSAELTMRVVARGRAWLDRRAAVL